MGRLHQFKSSANAREPVTIEFEADKDWPDGRSYEFPADINAGEWLDFVLEFGNEISVEDFPVEVVAPLLKMLLGTERLEQIRQETTVYELILIARTLWLEYVAMMGMLDEEASGDSGEVASVSKISSSTSKL